MDEYINFVQPAPPGLETQTPLVLIHDGGGTPVSYYFLESLDREVYGIQNPRFYTCEPWEHGLPEMARLYANLILSVVPSGPLLLGGLGESMNLVVMAILSNDEGFAVLTTCAGWSLGGLLSLEVASILMKNPAVRVVGIVMIDSIYPLVAPQRKLNVVPTQPNFSPETKAQTRRLVLESFKLSMSMVERWIAPVWAGCKDPEMIRKRAELEKKLFPLGPRASSSGAHSEVSNAENLQPLPKTILLRCSEYVPVALPDVPDAISRVDTVRDLRRLGWEKYPHDFTPTVMGIPGHHFSIFDEEHVFEVSARIKLACKMLEHGSV
ncbi:hypothetical protein FQN53_006193 [Emmonsiellopsis sp. PD_33]|nr:hypothetical protein FQN53_006193 [Emmonsiellopsis sp. PD_33]